MTDSRVRRDGLPYRTTAKRREAATTDELEAYKRLVREEAFRVQKEQGYCDDGLNRTLRTLGLPPKQSYRVPVTVTYTTTKFVTVDAYDVTSMELAEAHVLGLDEAALLALAGLRRDQRMVEGSARIATVPEPGAAMVGDLDPTDRERAAYPARRVCDRLSASGCMCTRVSGHEGPHVAGNGEMVTERWEPRSEADRTSYNGRWRAWGYFEGEDSHDAVHAAYEEGRFDEWRYPIVEAPVVVSEDQEKLAV